MAIATTEIRPIQLRDTPPARRWTSWVDAVRRSIRIAGPRPVSPAVEQELQIIADYRRNEASLPEAP